MCAYRTDRRSFQSVTIPFADARVSVLNLRQTISLFAATGGNGECSRQGVFNSINAAVAVTCSRPGHLFPFIRIKGRIGPAGY